MILNLIKNNNCDSIRTVVINMFKSEYRKEVIDVIKDIVFLNSYDRNLVGICLYGYCDPDNEMDLICFYNNLDKKNHQTFSNTYCIGDTDIKSVYLDIKRYNAFKAELFNGVIIYDKDATLSSLLNEEIIKHHSYCVASNEIKFDIEFTKELIDLIILNGARKKDANERYRAIRNINENLVVTNKSFCLNESDEFIETMNNYNRIFMKGEELELHNKALMDIVSDLKSVKLSLKK